MKQHEIRVMSVEELSPAAYNPRQISARAMKGLKESLSRFGVVQPIVWNERTKVIVGGHQRVKALKATGETEVQVVVVDLDETEERALNVALNNPHISGEFDDGLEELLQGIRSEDLELFDALNLDELLEPQKMERDGEKTPDPEPNPVSKLGDTWLLGENRIRCGSSTEEDDVLALFNGRQPGICVTDQPYGVNYDASWREEFGSNVTKGKVTNDHIVDWTRAWELCGTDVIYNFHPSLYCHHVMRHVEDAGYVIRAQLIWDKGRAAISRGHYHWGHEPCLYAVKKGATAKWGGDRKQTTVWRIPIENISTIHSTQKPLECMATPLRNHTFELAYDPFCGSGSTIIAGEQEGVVVYGMEIEPKYIDVIVKRWEEFTGGIATLEATGQTYVEVAADRGVELSDGVEDE